MSVDLLLKPSCGGCGSTTDLYGSNCKHMTLCLTCGKTMAENKAKCFDCGATVTRLIREYSVRASSGNDKNYFIGRFVSGLPDFSKKKSAENKWSLQKDGLQSRQVTDALREKYKNKPWLLEDETGQSQYQGHLEGAQSATYYLLMMERKEFVAIPAGSWYNFNKVAQYKQLTLEEAEEKMRNRKKTADGYERWMMKAANNGPAAFGERGMFDEKESNVGGGKSRKKTGEDDEGHVSDKGEEDEEEEAARRSRLGLNEKGGDDDEEGPRGGDLDQDDDDIEKGDDWEHEEIFTDDDEAVGNDPEEREDLAPEVPAPPEIKQDDDDEDEDNEEGGGLSKSGKELKKLLGRTSGLNESDAEDDDDDDDVDDEAGVPPVIASKQKDVPKEEPADNSPLKPAATATARGTSSTSKPSKGKRKLNEETKASNGAPPKKVKTENEPKSSVKDENGSSSKSNAPPKGVPPAPSSKGGSSTTASGPVSEEEIRAVLMQKTPVTTQDLVAKFKARLRSSEDKKAFAEILKRISKIQKTTNGSSYVILRDR
ncbi:Transcription initiation factor IIF subunit alpha [Spatholobus suberectus]|nr:Transcription initiation factor IIF subunit alpha [Spatholobus suberectus]